jgi:hypothetical protein
MEFDNATNLDRKSGVPGTIMISFHCFPARRRRVPHPPGFPVRFGGSNDLHAAFLEESRTRCHGWSRAVGNPGSFARFAKGGIPRISIPTVAYPTLCKERKGWGTHCYCYPPASVVADRGVGLHLDSRHLSAVVRNAD